MTWNGECRLCEREAVDSRGLCKRHLKKIDRTAALHLQPAAKPPLHLPERRSRKYSSYGIVLILSFVTAAIIWLLFYP